MNNEQAGWIYKPQGYGIQCDMLDDWLTDQLCYYCGLKLILPFTPTDSRYYVTVRGSTFSPDHVFHHIVDGYGRAVVDHCIPRSRGGANSPSNYKWACFECNNEKRTKTDCEYIEFLQNERAEAWELRNQRFIDAGMSPIVEYAPPLQPRRMLPSEIESLRRAIPTVTPRKAKLQIEQLFRHVEALEAEITALKALATPPASSPGKREDE